MPFPNSWTLRKRLVALVVATLLPLAALAAVGLAWLDARQREHTRQDMISTARVLMAAVDSEIESSISALLVLGTSRSLAAGDLKTFYAEALRAQAVRPTWLTVLVHGPTGEYLLNLREPPGKPLPRGPVDAESIEAALKRREPAVGVILTGRVTQQLTIPLRVPVLSNGAVQHVLSVPLRPESLLVKLVNSDILGRDGVAVVVDRRGNVVARTRGQADFAGKPASADLRKMLAAASEGWGEGTTLDGQLTYTAYTRSSFSGLTVAIGLPSEVFLAPWRRSYWALMAGVLAALAIAVSIALFIAERINKPIRSLAFAARALGRGEQPPVSDPAMPEVREVGLALESAASARLAAEAQREQLLERERVARAAAEAANRGKDEFLAMLGHELRNPLGAINNSALLLDNPALTERQRASTVAIIRRQGAQMKRLVDDLLDVGRVMTGKIYLERRRIDLAALVADTVSSLAAAGKTSRHEVHIETSHAWIDADPTRVEQIVTNLVTNAVNHTPAGGRISVKVTAQDADAVLTVADTGQGIAAEALPRVYDLFFQGAQFADRPQGGLGIGLTLVQRLTRLHGGETSAASEGPGHGATFTVRLPLVSGNAGDAPARQPGAIPTPLDILIVEDNPDARESLRMLLELAGHRVRTAEDGVQGIAQAKLAAPQVALIDIGLPGIDGYGVAREIRARYRQTVTLVAVTGYGSDEDAARAVAAGFDLHMTKPVDMEALAELFASLS